MWVYWQMFYCQDDFKCIVCLQLNDNDDDDNNDRHFIIKSRPSWSSCARYQEIVCVFTGHHHMDMAGARSVSNNSRTLLYSLTQSLAHSHMPVYKTQHGTPLR